MLYVTALAEAEPDRSISDLVDTAMAQTGYGSWLYGSLSTVFHNCVEGGLIFVSGHKRHPESRQQQRTYRVLPKELREINFKHWLDKRDQIALDKLAARIARRKAKIAREIGI
jgi:hypothetical protein